LKPWYFSGFFLPIAKIGNLLQWSLFTFIYNRSKQCAFHIHVYISHHFTAREDMNSTNWPCSQCVALQLNWSSIAPHRYRGGHGFDPVEALIFFRLLPSNCLNWKFIAMITLHFQFRAF